MTLICLDTTWTVDFFRNRPEAVRKLELLRQENAILASTTVTVFETLYGFFLKNDQKRAQQALQFFKGLPLLFSLDFDSSCKAAEVAAELANKGASINHLDSLIAGSMLRNGCNNIVTSNVKDFHKIKEVSVH